MARIVLHHVPVQPVSNNFQIDKWRTYSNGGWALGDEGLISTPWLKKTFQTAGDWMNLLVVTPVITPESRSYSTVLT